MYKKFITDTKKLLSKQDGVALMSVLIVFSVSLIILGSGSMLALNNLKASSNKKEDHSAYYLAEAGAQEFSDLMLDYLEDPSNKASLKFTNQEDLVKAINQEVYKNLRSHQEVDGKGDSKIVGEAIEVMGKEVLRNIFIQATGEVIDDSYIISSSASIGDATRTVEIKVSNILAFLSGVAGEDNPGSGDDNGVGYGFIDEYGLIIQDNFDIGKMSISNNEIYGNMFLLNNKTKTSKVRGNLAFENRNSNKSYFYSTSSDNPQSIADNINNSKFSDYLKPIDIKNQEPTLPLQKIEFPPYPSLNSASNLNKKNFKNISRADYEFEDKKFELEEGIALLDLSMDNSEDNYRLEEFVIKEDNKGVWNSSLLYIEVKEKHVHLHVVKKIEITGSLIVLGEGSLTIHDHSKNDSKLEPLVFTGVINREPNDKRKITQNQVNNNLVFMSDSSKKLTFRSVDYSDSVINATLISRGIDVKYDTNYLKNNIFSLNIFDLDESKKGSLSLPSLAGNIQDNFNVLVYAPHSDLTVLYKSGNLVKKYKGFIYVGNLKDDDWFHLSFEHSTSFIKLLPPIVQELVQQISGVSVDSSEVVEYQEIKFQGSKEVTP